MGDSRWANHGWLTRFKIAAGDTRHFGLSLPAIFHPRNRKNDIPSLDQQNQRPWNVIVNVSYEKVMQP